MFIRWMLLNKTFKYCGDDTLFKINVVLLALTDIALLWGENIFWKLYI